MRTAALLAATILLLACIAGLMFWANDELAAAVEFEADAADYEPEPGGYWGDADANPCLDPNVHIRETGCEECTRLVREAQILLAVRRAEVAHLEASWCAPAYGGPAC